jgi:hypothetical protein
VTSYDVAVEITPPDDSDGMSAILSGDALAVGDDTLVEGSVSATMVDGGTVSTFDGSIDMLAAAQDEESAFASADTFADVSGANISIAYNQETEITEQSADGSLMLSSSTTDIVAIDVSASLDSGGGVDQVAEGDAGGELLDPVLDVAPEADAGDGSVCLDEGGGSESEVVLDGNVAVIDFFAEADGEDTLVVVDAFVLTVEDELSVGGVVVEMAVG